jgi:hypothetical protein
VEIHVENEGSGMSFTVSVSKSIEMFHVEHYARRKTAILPFACIAIYLLDSST